METRGTGWHGELERFTPDATLRVATGGKIGVATDPASPLYFTAAGLSIRVDDLLALLPGSPVRLTLSAKARTALEAATAQVAKQEATERTLAAQATTIASHTVSLAALSPLPAPQPAVPALVLGAPIDLLTALAAIVELQATVALLRLRLQGFGVIAP